MTTPRLDTPPAGPETPTSVSAAPTARGVWHRWRAPLLVAAVIAAVAVLLVIAQGTEEGRPLDPDDTSLEGSAALAALLRDQGVRVVRVTGADAAVAAAGSGDALLLVTDASTVPPAGLRRLAALPSDRLLVGPGPAWQTLAPGVRIVGEARPRSREPECALPAAVRAGSAYTGGLRLAGPAGTTGCYPDAGDPTLLSYAGNGRTITVVADGQFMTNLRLADDGNAALALNLAGAHRTVVWLVAPDEPPAGVAGSGGRGIMDMIPEGVRWALLQLAVAVALVALWRGRRLGPVVAERLPVVVRASETVEGRGRLYRARRARDRASAALRAGFLHRVVPRLGLGRDAGRDAIVAATAARSGQDPRQVSGVLYGPPPADDAGLVALAGHLDTLERQVRDS